MKLKSLLIKSSLLVISITSLSGCSLSFLMHETGNEITKEKFLSKLSKYHLENYFDKKIDFLESNTYKTSSTHESGVTSPNSIYSSLSVNRENEEGTITYKSNGSKDMYYVSLRVKRSSITHTVDEKINSSDNSYSQAVQGQKSNDKKKQPYLYIDINNKRYIYTDINECQTNFSTSFAAFYDLAQNATTFTNKFEDRKTTGKASFYYNDGYFTVKYKTTSSEELKSYVNGVEEKVTIGKLETSSEQTIQIKIDMDSTGKKIKKIDEISDIESSSSTVYYGEYKSDGYGTSELRKTRNQFHTTAEIKDPKVTRIDISNYDEGWLEW